MNEGEREVEPPELASRERADARVALLVEADEREDHGEHGDPDPRLEEPGHPPERQGEVDEPEDGRDDQEPQEEDLRPQPGDGQRIARDVVDAEGDRQP